jgi:YD repeat-containing protein
MQYDAMNRLTHHTKPDSTVETYVYNKGGLLETIRARTRGAETWTEFISNIHYNEKGRRTDVYFGNSSKTRYDYDAQTFRLKRLLTTRNTGGEILQDIHYTYDPEGNIVQQTDDARQDIYFNNNVITPTGKYVYDALYRITKAIGRELTGLGMATDVDFANSIPIPKT